MALLITSTRCDVGQKAEPRVYRGCKEGVNRRPDGAVYRLHSRRVHRGCAAVKWRLTMSKRCQLILKMKKIEPRVAATIGPCTPVARELSAR